MYHGTETYICAYVSEYCRSANCSYAQPRPAIWFAGKSIKPGDKRTCWRFTNSSIKPIYVPMIQFYDNMVIPKGGMRGEWLKEKGVLK